MPDSPGEGSRFSADLYELYEVAQNDLRPLAEQYSGYSAKVDQTTAFNLDPAPVAGVMSRGSGIFRSGSALLALRDDVQYAFAKSSENIEAAATTLIEVAENYAGADDETQSDFNALLAEGFPDGEEPGTPPRPPVYPDGSRNQGRPVPED
ncbi:hypothetical protein [Glycomyces arizonensis]|uniref:hypothetical protein n=1 Tax=Glycomyces arizonensis TaxID=256035 RepID=UPI000411DE42|nr:hypothetical protein [Glycomyces arizonensis]